MWDGTLVVVPVGKTDLAGLPVLEPVQVTDNQITVEALASALNADVTLLKYYNLCRDGEILRKGDWMLVPRQR